MTSDVIKKYFLQDNPRCEQGGDEFNKVVAAKKRADKIRYFLRLLETYKPLIEDNKKNGVTQPSNFETGEMCPICRGKVRARGFEIKSTSYKKIKSTSYKLYDHCYIACASTAADNAKSKYTEEQYERHNNVKKKYGENSTWPYWKFSPTKHGWKLERREWNDVSKMAFHFIMYAPPL